MLNKSQSISARLSAEDYAYLMSIDSNGALTQSEKVRELIAMARESVGVQSFARAYMTSAEAILPLLARYKDEREQSLVVEALLDFIAEGAAAIQVCSDEVQLAPALEQRLLPAVEALLEKILLVSVQENPRVVHQQTAEVIKSRIDGLLHK